jgi:hypothetical protein
MKCLDSLSSVLSPCLREDLLNVGLYYGDIFSVMDKMEWSGLIQGHSSKFKVTIHIMVFDIVRAITFHRVHELE